MSCRWRRPTGSARRCGKDSKGQWSPQSGQSARCELRNRGIEVDLEPVHPKLGHLVKESAGRAAALLEAKRQSGVTARTATAGARVAAVGPQPIAANDDVLHAKNPLLKACRREPVPHTPIWLMRQAGRYMPEYRKVRDQLSFLEMCQRPAIAAEVTVTAVERLGVDAAIIFADILLPLVPMGVGLRYEKGDGPMIDRPLRTAADLDRIPPIDVKETLDLPRRGDSDGARVARPS